MAAQQGTSGELLESLTAGLEQAIDWTSRHRRWLGAAAAAVLLALVTTGIYGRLQQRRRLAATDAYASALLLADAPLEHDLVQMEQTMAAQRRERRQAHEARVAAHASEQGAGKKLAAAPGARGDADDDGADDPLADDLEAEAAQLAEEEAEADAFVATKRRGHTFVDDQARQTAALAAFAAIAEAATSGPVNALAALEAARAEARLQQPAAALARLQGLLAKLGQQDALWPIVATRLAAAYEHQGDEQGAMDTLSQVARNEQRVLVDEAGLQRARLLAKRHEPDAARELLQAVQRDVPDTPLSDEIVAALLSLPPTGAAPAAPPPAEEKSSAPGAAAAAAAKPVGAPAP